MNKLTAKGGIASVIHKPIEKNSRKSVYTCESVNDGSLRIHVKPKAITKTTTK